MPVVRDGTTFTSGHTVRHMQPLSGLLLSIVLSLASIAVISSFLALKLINGRFFRAVTSWTALLKIPFVQWVVLAVYLDSWCFVFATAMIQYGFGVDSAYSVCDSAILLCIVCYVSSKILVYLFLAEKAYIIRSSHKPRLRSKFFWFNSIGMLVAYTAVAGVNFRFRITKMQGGQCVIGMQKAVVIPLIAFDVLVNVYLTLLFISPLCNMYTFKSPVPTPASARLRSVANRTLVGAICTLTSSVVNLAVLMSLNGEPGWVCLMCCNSDILFSVIVIQWVTSPDASQRSGLSSRQDSRELGESRNVEAGNTTAPGRTLRNGQRRAGELDDLQDFEVFGVTDHRPRTVPSAMRRELSTEAIIDGRATISASHVRTSSGSTDTMPSPKRFNSDVPAAANDRREVAAPQGARVRSGNRYISRLRLWRPRL